MLIRCGKSWLREDLHSSYNGMRSLSLGPPKIDATCHLRLRRSPKTSGRDSERMLLILELPGRPVLLFAEGLLLLLLLDRVALLEWLP